MSVLPGPKWSCGTASRGLALQQNGGARNSTFDRLCQTLLTFERYFRSIKPLRCSSPDLFLSLVTLPYSDLPRLLPSFFQVPLRVSWTMAFCLENEHILKSKSVSSKEATSHELTLLVLQAPAMPLEPEMANGERSFPTSISRMTSELEHSIDSGHLIFISRHLK